MVFMHILPLCICLTIVFCVAIISWITFFTSEKTFLPGLWTFGSTVLFVFLGVWLFGACSRPYKVDFIETLNVDKLTTPNGVAQVIWYSEGGTLPRKKIMLNLNSYMDCQIPEGSKVRHTRYLTGPYCGVSFDMEVKKFDHFEVVND